MSDSGRFDSEHAASSDTIARPEPQPLMAARTASAPYPVSALGLILADAVEATARHAKAPLSIAAQSTLAAISLAVQAHFDVELPTGAARPTTLHLVSVADSGDRKSTCDD